MTPLTLSPTGHSLLQEARRLRDADLKLIHVSKRFDDEARLKETVQQSGLDAGSLEIIRQERNPYTTTGEHTVRTAQQLALLEGANIPNLRLLENES